MIMDILVDDYLRLKFGDEFICKYDVFEDVKGSNTEGYRYGGDLSDILAEFKLLLQSERIEALLNPRTNEFTHVDKDRGIIIGSFKSDLTKDAKG